VIISLGEEGGGIELMLELGRKGRVQKQVQVVEGERRKRSTFKLSCFSLPLSYFSLE